MHLKITCNCCFFFGVFLFAITIIIIVFDNPKIASLMACVLWIVLLVSGYFAVNFNQASKTLFCFLSPACLNMSIQTLVQYEGNILGVQWDNIHDVYEDFSFGTAIIMFYVDYVVYMVLALYLDNVWPSRYGSHKVPWFCLMPSFWRPNRMTDELEQELQASTADMNEDKYKGESFEDINGKYKNAQPAISIRKLVKYYQTNLVGLSSGLVKAVNDISMDIHKGEVFVLLGHNGT